MSQELDGYSATGIPRVDVSICVALTRTVDGIADRYDIHKQLSFKLFQEITERDTTDDSQS